MQSVCEFVSKEISLQSIFEFVSKEISLQNICEFVSKEISLQSVCELRNNSTVFEELEVSIMDLTVANAVLLATRSGAS